jgi:hypothetical protein
MSFVLKEVLRAAIRIEKKLDEVLKMILKSSKSAGPGDLPPMAQPLGALGQVCPLCQKPISYRPVNLPADFRAAASQSPNVVILRSCGCEPALTELPIQGEVNE